MNNKPQIELIVCFLVGLLICVVAVVGAFYSEEVISLSENRMLSPKPELTSEDYFSGAYYKAWDEYITDHIPYRDELLKVADTIKLFKGFQPEVRMVQITADFGADNQNETKQDLLILPDRLLELYQFDPELNAEYAAALNLAAKHLPANINFYSMLIPTRISFENEAYQKLSGSQPDAIAQIGAILDKRIVQVDVYGQLAEHTAEYIYFRTDHHWTALGAYYGLLAFASSAGIEPVDINQYREFTVEGFLGFLYQKAPDPILAKNPDTLSYYMLNHRNNSAAIYTYDVNETLRKSRNGTLFSITAFHQKSYGGFLGGDYPMIIIDGNVKNGRVLTIVKDSYGNAFTPWLTPYFEKIIVIDPRHFNEDFYKLLTDNSVTDLLVLNYMKATTLEEYLGMMNRFFDPALENELLVPLVTVYVNGEQVVFDQVPVIENGRTLVPLRAIFEALGADVEWDQRSQTVTAVKEDTTISFVIGSDILVKNNEEIKLETPARIIESRTLVPARAVAESFGAEVSWDSKARKVTITSE